MINLERSPLFVDVAPEAIAAIAGSSTRKRYVPGATVIAADDVSTELCFILEGRVAIRSFADDGQEVAYLEMSAGSFFGELAALDGRTRAADVVAISQVVIAMIRAEFFRQTILKHPQIGLNLAVHLAGKVRDLSARVFEFSTLPSAQRIRRELVRLARGSELCSNGIMIKPAPTHYEIAARTSTHREAVSRELAALSARQILRTGRQMICITDMSALQRLAQC